MVEDLIEGRQATKCLDGEPAEASLTGNRRSAKAAGRGVLTLNVEAGLPTLEEARKRVLDVMRSSRKSGVRVLKIIHGYGSSGKGGTLCVGLRKSFSLRRKEKVIREYVPGEDFSIFDPRTVALLEEVPELRGDPDLDATNEGITVVWLA
jgi:hypothetical protein